MSRSWPLQAKVRHRVTELGCARRTRRGCRAGARVRYYRKPNVNNGNNQRSADRSSSLTDIDMPAGNERCIIPVIVGRRATRLPTCARHPRTLIDVAQRTAAPARPRNDGNPPTLYVLNAAAITKPHAIEHLAADLVGFNVDIAVVTETHLKTKHADDHFNIDGYALFRRDRSGRRGGGVAVYVSDRLFADL